MITGRGVIRATRKFQALAAKFRRTREPLKAMDDAAVKIWETKTEFGYRFDLYSNGRLSVWFDPTCQIVVNTGAGPREHTQSLYGRVEISPRPASGTRALDSSVAPTQYDLGTGLET